MVPCRPVPERVLNALCVDADDLTESCREAGYALPAARSDVGAETGRLLEALDALDLRATFFIPGHFLAGAARLVPEMAAAGHEIASHGTLHRAVEEFTPEEFRRDVERSKKTLEDLTGQPVDTYKAPQWSITPRCPWAYDVLLEAGFRVDHSALPALKPSLGRPAASLEPFRYDGALLVVPVTCVTLLGRSFPFPGGFYNAWLPLAFHHAVYDRLNRGGLPFNFYFHPFEHSPAIAQRRWLKGSLPISLYALHSGRYEGRLAGLADRYRLGRLRDAYAGWLSPAA